VGLVFLEEGKIRKTLMFKKSLTYMGQGMGLMASNIF